MPVLDGAISPSLRVRRRRRRHVFKKLAAEALGISDVVNIVAPAD